MVDASLDGKKGENVILKQPSYRYEYCHDYDVGYLPNELRAETAEPKRDRQKART
jgi:hypothetical protein